MRTATQFAKYVAVAMLSAASDWVVFAALFAAFGSPITATSANRSGAVPAAVAGALGAIADDPQVLVIDSGSTPGGEPSTIVDARHTPPRLVRAGAVAWERVLDSIHP